MGLQGRGASNVLHLKPYIVCVYMCLCECVHARDRGDVGKILFEVHRVEKRLDGPCVTFAACLRLELRTSCCCLPRHNYDTHKNREGYKAQHELAAIVKTISMFVFVFSGNDEVPHASKVQADYSKFICSARTHVGQANIFRSWFRRCMEYSQICQQSEEGTRIFGTYCRRIRH